MFHSFRARKIKAAYYHANMTPEMRSRAHHGWLEGKYQVVVATIAFGLGIDKPDVRFVLHQSLSKSMENFYQVFTINISMCLTKSSQM